MKKATRIVALMLLLAMVATLCVSTAFASQSDPKEEVLIGAAETTDVNPDDAIVEDTESVDDVESNDESEDAAAPDTNTVAEGAAQEQVSVGSKAKTRFTIVGGAILGVCVLLYVGISVANKKKIKSKKSN